MEQEKADPESQVIRRRDVVDLGATFTQALSPLGDLVVEMKSQNVNTKLTSTHVRRLVIWMTILSAGWVYTSYMDHKNAEVTKNTADQQSSMVSDNKKLQTDLTQTNKELRELVALAREIDKTVDDIEEDQDTKPQLELVAETDPVKAKKAPMKLRVTPPTRASDDGGTMQKKPSPSPKATVDIPISARHF